ncbi:hypothetical protein [Nitratifractor sp.]
MRGFLLILIFSLEGQVLGAEGEGRAEILGVHVTGNPGHYHFAVTIRADETGCDRYTDWWEVLDERGRLLYRRILIHSHPDEQPFTRSGGPVQAGPHDRLYIRAHMHPSGYSGKLYVGTVAGGFHPAKGSSRFDPALSVTAPLPQGCAF